MSAYIILDTGEPTFLASTLGYGDLCRWIDTLSHETYPTLVQLRDHGACEPAARLAKELAAALAAAPPDSDTAHVAGELLDLLAGETDAVVGVSNGVVSGESESEPGAPPAP